MSKTLSEIKDQYAKEKGYENWADLTDFSSPFDEWEESHNEIALRYFEANKGGYATACCKATQQKCADNAVCFWPNVKKESITNPNNIVLL